MALPSLPDVEFGPFQTRHDEMCMSECWIISTTTKKAAPFSILHTACWPNKVEKTDPPGYVRMIILF